MPTAKIDRFGGEVHTHTGGQAQHRSRIAAISEAR